MKIVSFVERGGNVRSKRIKDGTKLEIKDLLRSNVHPESVLHTDGSGLYTNTGLVRIHESVDHKSEYVRDGKASRKVHTNTLEGFFSIFKRGLLELISIAANNTWTAISRTSISAPTTVSPTALMMLPALARCWKASTESA